MHKNSVQPQATFILSASLRMVLHAYRRLIILFLRPYQLTNESSSIYLADIFQGRIEYELIYSLGAAKHRVDYSVHIR